jgi:4-amino-4-deoxy-L-arabinose transferase-like glycosyltransferase
MTTAAPAWRDPALVLILLGSLILNTHRLGHSGLHYFDESFHAIVARNLLKHPLRPTLIDAPYLPYDHRQWGEAHVWLHKPILPLWTIAASYAVLGVNTMALRLPSAMLGTAAVALTFLIGRRLFGRPTALIAAALQASNPAIATLVQGYLFSDHVDIALLFWVEVGAYFLVRAIGSGSWTDVLAVGVAQGLAYLSKSYLAALLTGLAATAWLLPRVGLVPREDSKLKARHLLGLVAATLATAAPWTIHCARAFPLEFEHEHGYVLAHLGQGVENWGGPWDRLFFDYLITLYHAFYPALIASGVALLGSALIARRMPLWFVFAWLFGVLAPHAVSATKTPSATLIAMPAGFLLLAHLIAEGWRGRPRHLATWAAIMAVGAIRPPTIGRFGRGYPDPPRFGGVMLQATWVLEHLAIALAIVGAIEAVRWWIARGKPPSTDPSWSPCRQGLRVAALAATLVVGARVAMTAWSVTDLGSENQPFVAELADFARGRLPDRAVLLFEGDDRGEHQLAMFLLDRTCYQLRGRPADEVARRVRDSGGLPFVVTGRPAPWPRRFATARDPRALYEWQGPAIAAGPGDRPASRQRKRRRKVRRRPSVKAAVARVTRTAAQRPVRTRPNR